MLHTSLVSLLLTLSLWSSNSHAASCNEPVPEIKQDDEAPARRISAADEALAEPIPENPAIPIPQTATLTLTQVMQGQMTSEERSQNLSKASPTAVTIDIDPEKHYQPIWGFGATITESCLHNLKKLPSKNRTELLERLFSRNNGAGFSYLRVPVGANDYSLSNYTLADTPKDNKGQHIPDPELKHFSFKKDKPFADFVKEVRKINPDVQLMISPWTPPAWMKNNNDLKGGIVKPEAYDAYARYIMKTLDAYKKEGIEFEHMSIMNEPLIGWAKEKWGFSQGYMELDEQKKFISNNFAPLLKSRTDIKTRLLLLDHNWDMAAQIPEMLKDPKIKEISAGAALHCYGGHVGQLKEFVEQNPRFPTMQTECSASFTNDAVGGSFRWWLENQSIDAIRYGAAGALGWNICLDQKGEPRNNGCWGCQGLITIDQSKPKQPKLVYNEEYFALAQT